MIHERGGPARGDGQYRWVVAALPNSLSGMVIIQVALSNRRDPKPLLLPNSISFEIIVIDGEDGRQRLAFGKAYEGRIGEVHRAVAVPLHQVIQGTAVGVSDG